MQDHNSITPDIRTKDDFRTEVIHQDFLRPVEKKLDPVGRIWIGLLILVGAWGLVAYANQLWHGLGTTAMRNYVTWGLYIATFVFFIGLSHSGTLVSAILRITNQEWRRPITRSAELLTFICLLFGGMMPVIDMGRPDRIPNLILHGRIQSPLLWDIICIGTYFVGSGLFLYLPMIPDIALCRDKFKNDNNVSAFRKWIYRKMAMGWGNKEDQWKRLELCMHIMTIIIIPIAVSVHTVVSYIFAMTLRPGWSSTLFGPYFVAGALYSGSGGVVLIMAAFRKVYHLEKYITRKHFDLMGKIVLTLTLVYAYLNVNEYGVPAYKMEGADVKLLSDLFRGDFSIVFWTLQFGTVLLPILILSFPQGRRPLTCIIACSIIVFGAWVKRYVIVVATLLHPFLPVQNVPYSWSHYFPNWVEWSVTIGTFAGLCLLISLFSRIFPIVSIWEVEEGIEVDKTKKLAEQLRKKQIPQETISVQS